MDSIVSMFMNIFSNPKFQPLLENLKKQNDQFVQTETTRLLMDEGGSDGEDDEGFEEDEKLGETDKDIAMGMLKKMAKLFQYTSIQDKFILLIGVLFTVVHAASFPILAILFGKISNAYIAHTLLEMQNTTLHPPHEHSNGTVGATGKLALAFLTKVTSKVNPGMNASVIPTADKVGGGGYFGNVSLYNSNGTESIEDFATYVADFSLNYVYIGIAVFVASFFQTACFEWVAESQVYRIKQTFIYQMLRQDMVWFSRHTAGSLVLKLADDCERFREGVGQKFSLVIEYISIALFGAGIGLLINFKLTLVFLGSAPFILTKLLLLWKKIAERSTVQQKQYAKAGKICSEVLAGVRTVAALAGEKKEIERYKKAVLKSAHAADRKELLLGIGIGGMYLLIYSFYAVALWYAVNLLAQGAITPGEIYTVFFSLTICAFALGSLLPFVNSIASAFGCIQILGTVLDSVPKIDPYSTGGLYPKQFSGRVKFSNITFSYPGRSDTPVFKEMTLEVLGGQTVAIVGPGSSGKSTLINLLLRFYDPQRGQVKMDNYELKSLNVRWIREQISVVEQSANLFPGTILDNIRGTRTDIKLSLVIKAAKLAFVHDFIMTLSKGYMTPISLPGGKDYSIGHRQRICIARGIVLNKKILILDEAMSAIAVTTAKKIETNLANLRKNATTIVIAHKLAVAQSADFIIVLKDGVVAEQGTHQDLMKKHGVYYDMSKHEDLVESLRQEHRPPTDDPTTAAETDAEREMIAEYMQSTDTKRTRIDDNMDDGHHGKRKKKKRVNPSIMKVLSVVPRKGITLSLGILGCVLSGLVIPMLALCLGQILQMFLGDKEDLFSSGIFWVEMLIILAVTAGIGYSLRTIFISSVGEQLTQRLRLRALAAIIRQPISWFDIEKNTPGFLYARICSDVPFLKVAVGPRLGTAISAMITITTGLIIATIYGWQLALITSSIIPVLLIGFYIQGKTQEAAHKKFTTTRKNIIIWTIRCIKGIRMIHAHCRAFNMCQKLENFLFPALVEGQKQAMLYGLAYALSESIMFLTFGIAFRLGAELIREGVLSVPDLFTIFFVITFGSLSLGQATSFIPEYFKARLSTRYIFKLIDMKSAVDPLDKGGLKPLIIGRIELRDVVFTYPLVPHVKILQGASIIIPENSTIGIVGPVGGGKSTILSILERFYEIEEGEVLIDGINIKKINLKHLRQNIGYVPQEPNLFDMSITDNILYGYYGKAKDDELRTLVEQAAMAADADFITEELPHQFETKCGEHGKHLTAGQRQEVSLARAIMKNAPILLLDDPTSSLDAEEETRVHNAMHNAMGNRTCIIVSNSYASIKNCDYIAVLIEGKIAEYGKQKDLIKAKGVYYNFVREQGVKLIDHDETTTEIPVAQDLTDADETTTEIPVAQDLTDPDETTTDIPVAQDLTDADETTTEIPVTQDLTEPEED